MAGPAAQQSRVDPSAKRTGGDYSNESSEALEQLGGSSLPRCRALTRRGTIRCQAQAEPGAKSPCRTSPHLVEGTSYRRQSQSARCRVRYQAATVAEGDPVSRFHEVFREVLHD